MGIIKSEIDKLIMGVEDMIYKLVRRRFVYDCEDDIEEIVQTCRVMLWERSIAKFDTSRGVKLTTYLYSCIRGALKTIARTQARQQKRICITSVDPRKIDDVMQAPDYTTGVMVDKFLESLMANPEKYLTKRQAEVFRLMHEHPHMTLASIGEIIRKRKPGADGNATPSQNQHLGHASASLLRKRIKERLRTLGVEDAR